MTSQMITLLDLVTRPFARSRRPQVADGLAAVWTHHSGPVSTDAHGTGLPAEKVVGWIGTARPKRPRADAECLEAG